MNALTENTEIQTLIERYRQAIVAKDLEALMGFYADDIVSFDAVKALQFKGKAAYRAHWEECMNYCPGPHLFEFAQLHVVQGQDLAFAHWLVHCGGADDQGQVKGSWMRASAGYQRIGGQWRIVHEHWSAPFDMASGAALFELQP